MRCASGFHQSRRIALAARQLECAGGVDQLHRIARECLRLTQLLFQLIAGGIRVLVDTIRVISGGIQLDSCAENVNGSCMARGSDGHSGSHTIEEGPAPLLSLGGLGASGANAAPSSAITMEVGDTGSMALWTAVLLTTVLVLYLT